jgi:selenide,water dikinase
MVHEHLAIRTSLARPEEQILFDPQTSGGLLLSVPGDEAEDLISALHNAGVAVAARVAEVVEGPPSIEVV